MQRFEWLALIAGLSLATGIATAATKPTVTAVDVEVKFPGGARTTANVYARELKSGALVSGRVEAGQPRLTLHLSAGSYWFFAEPDDPGVPDLLGAHTAWSLCQAKAATAPPACEAHDLAEVPVERKLSDAVVIDDWYLPESIVRQLDESLHRNPDRPDDLELGAPRFSEYPARVLSQPESLRFDAASHPEGKEWQSAVGAAAEHGVNFAGHWLVATNACGEKCASYALVEWSSGKLFVPDALRSVSTALPCNRAQPVQHRADSRLIAVTQPDNRSVVTRYFLWDEEKGALTELASYRSSAERYCERE